MSLINLYSIAWVMKFTFVLTIFSGVIQVASVSVVDDSSTDQSDSNDEVVASFNEIKSNSRKILDAINRPCSNEGLILLDEMSKKIDLYSELDPSIHDQGVKYKMRCLFTFIANVFPIFSTDRISMILLDDWTNIADVRLKELKSKRKQIDTSKKLSVHDFYRLLDPNFDVILEKRLLFEVGYGQNTLGLLGNDEQSSQKIIYANAAFSDGKSGYCWPMQSDTFVTTNQLMEIYLTVFKQLDYHHSMFTISVLNKSFNLYSICKNIQRSVKDKNTWLSLPQQLEMITKLPMVHVGMEDAEFAQKYLSDLKKTTLGCTNNELVLLSKIEGIINYTNNEQLRYYLQFRTDLGKDIIIKRCQRGAIPRERHARRLIRENSPVKMLADTVFKLADHLKVIDNLKSGDVNEGLSLMKDEQIRSLIIEQEDFKTHLNKLMENQHLIYEPNDYLAIVCLDFRIIYPNSKEYIDSMSYLISHYPKHHLIVKMLNDGDSQALKNLLTAIVCQKTQDDDST